ncbi:hypothetical protein OHA70_23135 [Kribbella sp. NBC_00382]|uniref:hypothetical protein n=1 Tax=Kribbella sp. NBC_00382 TaxID=2975967 RepID=UPI002E1A5798
MKEPVALQLEARTAGHALLPGQSVNCPGKLQSDRPEKIGRQFTKAANVARRK